MGYRIYKYELQITDQQFVEMPAPFEILSVHSQYGQVMMWAKVSVALQGSAPTQLVRIGVFGTGHDLPDDIENASFIGTVLTEADQLVWHVWRLP